MTFAALAKENASFAVSGPTGEEIEYRSYPGPAFVEIWATVNRRPVDAYESVLVNTVHVRVSKADVAVVSCGNDEVRVDEKIYRVRRMLENSPGFFRVEAIL
jgi:hypothetical protein